MVDKDLEKTLNLINKKFGEGSAMLLSDAFDDVAVTRIPSGSLNLDLALGGGMPRGRTIELYGKESSGKTTIALLHAVEMQRAEPDKYCAFIDVEQAFDPELAESYGVDTNRLIISQPSTGEEAFDITEALIRSGKVSLVIIDSVSALEPEAEAAEDMSKQTIGLQARLMSKALRKLTPVANEFQTTIIFINQIREKVGVMYGEQVA